MTQRPKGEGYLEHEDSGMMAQFKVAPGALNPLDGSARP